MLNEDKKYAQVRWSVLDVMEYYDVTEKEAEEFLINNQRYLQDAMVEAGWRVIEDSAEQDGLKRIQN
tara:strand:+ start:382 stop:582 length:201 start_codon:yes stop_codon:yes gene_type:complete